MKNKENILVCAPSNYAADEITKRLVGYIPKRDLFRYVAPSYNYNLIDEKIKPFINFKDGFYHPTNASLLKFRVVVTTLVTASRLVNGGTPPAHFSYVFIDESGQATESETLIPIAGILSNLKKPGTISGHIVLAGDPKQLGPVIHSQRAKQYGFGISMLERLMTFCSVYKKDEKYNSALLTKLVKNYRSHPMIIEIPNKLYYDNELISAGDETTINAAIGWEQLPNKKFPIIFHAVMGKDEREANSPSFFNLQEIDVVFSYLNKLIGSRLSGMLIKEEHIGIITPYRKQVDKLKKACTKKNLLKVTIGSVEQFQGQERLIIIVSTVRSKPEFTSFDTRFHLGFLQNPKRFNVAITRSKALLIVIGNPNTLCYDDHWKSFIQFCKSNRSTKGVPFELSAENVELPVAINASILVGENNVEDGPDFSRCNS